MSNTNYFVLRRLHSLLGVFPLGVFLLNHLLTNSTAIISAEYFEGKVALIHLLGPFLPIVEAVLIFIPLALHIALGVYIALQAKMENRLVYPRNWAYKFQRWTGWIALIFITYHVIHLRFYHDITREPFSVELGEMFSAMPWAMIFIPAYIIGGLAVIYHFANGLCTFCMSWGITVGPTSQRNMAYAATGVAAILTFMLFSSVYSFNKFGRHYAGLSDTDKTAYVDTVHALYNHDH